MRETDRQRKERHREIKTERERQIERKKRLLSPDNLSG